MASTIGAPPLARSDKRLSQYHRTNGKVQHFPVNISFVVGALSEGILIEATYDNEHL
jgi:hypothetical protein